MKYFGTDGVRGIANLDLTCELALKIGRAASSYFNGEMIVSKDPRLSSDMIEMALVSGILSKGNNAYLTGIIPTPALSLLLSNNGKKGGAMISASHNPIEDNGIKFFDEKGFKLREEDEEKIEKLMKEEIKLPIGRGGKVIYFNEAKAIYIKTIIEKNKLNLNGLKIALDLAYGATTTVAPEIFSNLNSSLTLFNEKPDGEKINVGCGSTNPEFLSRKIKDNGFDLGFSFDGDGDRVIAFDENGEVFDGDMIMFILAKYLKIPSIVITVMSNFGLKVLLKKYGIKFYEVPVGDRNVLYKMIEVNASLGGEQSGHIIYLPQSNTGDGIITSLLLLKVLVEQNKPLSELNKEFIKYPQILRNIKVNDKKAIMKDEIFFREVNLWNEKLNGKGRVLVRPSGTENLIRIMVEGEEEKEILEIVDYLEDLLKKRLTQNLSLGDEEEGSQ
ncbi:MAG TPA: phosphoglucosamine mutase [Caldisericia bacterium]|nr:phosphoglucosamine mutase [Caldisericia bacterium]HPP43482.1 phosphoglucosamine mutase [Caldisericia bacterium]HRT37305.1 phosphoglucosamine mutase [Caldisericia bacterium]